MPQQEHEKAKTFDLATERLDVCEVPKPHRKGYSKYLRATSPSKPSFSKMVHLQKIETAPEIDIHEHTLADATESDRVETPRRAFNPKPVTSFGFRQKIAV